MLAFSSVSAEENTATQKYGNVVKLVEIIDNDEEDRLIIVEEFCKNGTVLNWDSKNFTFAPNQFC